MSYPAVVVRTATTKRFCSAIAEVTVFRDRSVMLEQMPNAMKFWSCREAIAPAHDVLMLPKSMDDIRSFHITERMTWEGSDRYSRDRFAFPVDAKKPFDEYPSFVRNHLEILLALVTAEISFYPLDDNLAFSVKAFDDSIHRRVFRRIYSSGLIAKLYSEWDQRKIETCFGSSYSPGSDSYASHTSRYAIKKKQEPAPYLTEICKRESSPSIHGKGLDLLWVFGREAMDDHRLEHGQPTSPLKSERNRKLADVLRSRTTAAIKGGSKAGSAVRDLGCSVDVARQHIQSQFHNGMYWENHGKHWHVDHFYPLSKADLTNRVQFLAAANYQNLRPMLAGPNIAKSNKVLPEAQKLFSRLCDQFTPTPSSTNGGQR